jgi:hypothetical protein
MRLLRITLAAAALGALATACAAPPGSVAPSRTPTPAGVGAGPVGAWQVTITEDDFAAAGLNNPGANVENSGTFTWTVLADGTFTETQQSDHPVKWPVFKGTWTQTAPGEVGLRTTFPADFAGEYIVLGWERQGSALRLRLIDPPDDPVLKVHFESHPWLPAP